MDSKEKIISEISTAVENLSLKIEALQAKVNEYMPFGRIPIYIKET